MKHSLSSIAISTANRVLYIHIDRCGATISNSFMAMYGHEQTAGVAVRCDATMLETIEFVFS